MDRDPYILWLNRNDLKLLNDLMAKYEEKKNQLLLKDELVECAEVLLEENTYLLNVLQNLEFTSDEEKEITNLLVSDRRLHKILNALDNIINKHKKSSAKDPKALILSLQELFQQFR